MSKVKSSNRTSQPTGVDIISEPFPVPLPVVPFTCAVASSAIVTSAVTSSVIAAGAVTSRGIVTSIVATRAVTASVVATCAIIPFPPDVQFAQKPTKSGL